MKINFQNKNNQKIMKTRFNTYKIIKRNFVNGTSKYIVQITEYSTIENSFGFEFDDKYDYDEDGTNTYDEAISIIKNLKNEEKKCVVNHEVVFYLDDELQIVKKENIHFNNHNPLKCEDFNVDDTIKEMKIDKKDFNLDDIQKLFNEDFNNLK